MMRAVLVLCIAPAALHAAFAIFVFSQLQKKVSDTKFSCIALARFTTLYKTNGVPAFLYPLVNRTICSRGRLHDACSASTVHCPSSFACSFCNFCIQPIAKKKVCDTKFSCIALARFTTLYTSLPLPTSK